MRRMTRSWSSALIPRTGAWLAAGQQDNNNNRQQQQTYTGCSVNFKRRFGKHKRSVRKIEEKQTTFSTYIWKNFNQNGEEGRLQALQDTRGTPIARARPFNPGNGKCNLCLLLRN